MPTTTTPTRRAVFRGIGLTSIAAGVAARAAAAPPAPAEAPPNAAEAELIRLSAEVVAIEDKIKALHRVRRTVEDERRTEPELSALSAIQYELLDQIEAAAVAPATLAGARAVARAAVAIAPLDVHGEICPGGDSQWLAFVVVEFLAAGGAA